LGYIHNDCIVIEANKLFYKEIYDDDMHNYYLWLGNEILDYLMKLFLIISDFIVFT
jgi:hypothetical protein